MEYITEEKLVKALQWAVDQKGWDYVYVNPTAGDLKEGCVYTDTTTKEPSCIIGYALDHLGVPFEVLVSLDSTDAETGPFGTTEIGGWEVQDRLESAGYTFVGRALNIAEETQRLQDFLRPWGAALTCALREVEKNNG